MEELLRLFTKAVRAHQLYLPNNPVYKGAIEALRGAFAPIWRQTGELVLRFGETDIRWYGVPVLVETSKSADSLPWTFFKDGLREIQLSPGFETEELNKLLEILQRVRKAAPDEDDLLTLLWEADFADLRYHYVDLGAEQVAPFGAPETSQKTSPDQIQAATHQEPEQSGVVNMQDFDATLYFLDEKELNYLREEVEREYSSDLRANVVAILLDIYESQAKARDEIGGLVENLMLLMLAAGKLRTVGYLLAESQTAVRGADITPEQKSLLSRLPESLSAPEPLGQLLQALDESADIPAQAELTALFEQLRAPALGPIFSWLPRIASPAVRTLVEKAADRLASANTTELVGLIASKDRTVALEAIRRAGSMKAAAAVVPIAKLLAASSDVPLRQAGVQALIDIGSAGALQALERSIEDTDRDVRVAAVRALGAKAYKGVFNRLESVVKGKEIRSVDLTEKMAFFEAYGAMCGDGGVAFLDEILNRKRLFGKREDPEIRACAAMALGRINTKRARDTLQNASGEKDVVVRNAVGRAMRGGGPSTGGRPSSA
ncbi:MAG TPA: HEAT repeat domain-containing protein [Gemmatimonadaceae bacterium]|nr:HEAT repeat domain-containing protein [Gemmatimonadaceae bacterium]